MAQQKIIRTEVFCSVCFSLENQCPAWDRTLTGAVFLSNSVLIEENKKTKPKNNDQTKKREQKVGLQIIPMLAYYSIV